ncbi:F-box protein GID2 [Acorus gramineus]|uniref:F-box protein GID2 n=1 Tax=Acorus gramineus TaxID=55184 RepID=A0AAV9BJH6_ACOGR|nr:F-box protein GID2 [Acorus gramineus]
MKRRIESLSVDGEKRRKIDEDEEVEEVEEEVEMENQVDRLGEDLLFEVLKHADAQSLASASCVSKLWHRTAQDERLWEIVCGTPTPNSNKKQLRSVVLALGGFRRLHSLYLWPLNKPPPSVEAAPQPQPSLLFPDFSAPAASSSKTTQRATPKRWGKDEVNLSLSLLSIRYYEKMSLPNRGL